MTKQVNILGTEYLVKHTVSSEDKKLESLDGYIDNTSKKIVVNMLEKEWDSVDNLKEYESQVLRHEIIHAFLDESGLRSNSEWARNEEMVDFFAIQFYKIAKAFKEVDC